MVSKKFCESSPLLYLGVVQQIILDFWFFVFPQISMVEFCVSTNFHDGKLCFHKNPWIPNQGILCKHKIPQCKFVETQNSTMQSCGNTKSHSSFFVFAFRLLTKKSNNFPLSKMKAYWIPRCMFVTLGIPCSTKKAFHISQPHRSVSNPVTTDPLTTAGSRTMQCSMRSRQCRV